MAFSTQKNFFLINDLCRGRDDVSPGRCPPALMSYSSCNDYRAWSHSKVDQTNYLLDFISGDCQSTGGQNGRVDKSEDHAAVVPTIVPSDSTEDSPKKRSSSLDRNVERSMKKSSARSNSVDSTPRNITDDKSMSDNGSDKGATDDSNQTTSSTTVQPIAREDSVMEAACLKLTEIDTILHENEELRKQLHNSSEKLQTVCRDRDQLRQLIGSMVGVEDELRRLKARAERAKELERQMVGDGDELERLRREREDIERQLCEFERTKHDLNMYQIHYNEMASEMRRVSAKLVPLETELFHTKNRLEAAETTICQYEHDIEELMELVCDLNNENKALTEKTDSQIADLCAQLERESQTRKQLEQQVEHLRHCHGNVAIELDISVNSYDPESSDTDQSSKPAIESIDNAIMQRIDICTSSSDESQSSEDEEPVNVTQKDCPECARLRPQIEELEALLAASEHENEKKASGINDLKLKLQKVEQDLEDCMKECPEFELVVPINETKDVSSQTSQLEQTFSSLQKHNASLQQALDELNKDYETKAMQWSDELTDCRDLLGKAKVSLEKRKSELCELKEILKRDSSDDLDESVEHLTSKNHQLKAENHQLLEQLAQLAAENERLKEARKIERDTELVENDRLKEARKAERDTELAENERPNEARKIERNTELAENERLQESKKIERDMELAGVCAEYLAEIEELKANIAKHWDDMKQNKEQLDELQKEVDELRANKLQLEDELMKMKTLKDAQNKRLAELESDGSESDELQRLRDENSKLAEDNRKLKAEIKVLEEIANDIENESRKFEQLESLIETFEQKSREFESPSRQPADKAPAHPTDKPSNIHEKLKQCQQQLELREVELEKCKLKLGKLEKHKSTDASQDKLPNALSATEQHKLASNETIASTSGKLEKHKSTDPSQDNLPNASSASGQPKLPSNETIASTSEELAPTSSSPINSSKTAKPPSTEVPIVFSGLKPDKTSSSKQLPTSSGLLSTVDVIPSDSQEIRKKYEEKIRKLKNEIETLKAKLAAKTSKSSPVAKSDSETDSCSKDKQLNKICTKIIKCTINSLILKELKYLHCAVYRAGLRLKPAAACFTVEEIKRCCECGGFVCCLPSFPKDDEKEFVERINRLECELDKANCQLQELRDTIQTKSNCNRRCCTMNVERRTLSSHGINDAVNRLLKCARQEKRNKPH